MTTTEIGFVGQTPSVMIGKCGLSEKEKYEKMWAVDAYRGVSPGELAGNTFLSVVKPNVDDEVIDFGCGTGRGSFYLWAMGKMNVTSVDFAANCLDDDVKLAMKNFPEKIRFMEQDLTQPASIHARYGYCTDVMEHIPPEDVDSVLENVLNAAQSVFFRISTVPDVMGPAHLGEPLHLTVESYSWWAKKFLDHDVIILHSEDLGNAVDFYVTGWSKDLPKNPKLNTDEERILANIRENAKFDCKSVEPHMIQEDAEIMILCGGPSLNDFEDEILENYRNGMKVVTLNGAYNWAQERGIHRVNQCVLDARPFNKRFVEPVRNDCNYFIATQCDPSLFEVLPKDRTYFWHCTGSQAAIDVVTECYPDHFIAGGGSTVALRAIVLMRTLGFRKQHIYGMDSCLVDGDHHAFEQKENDGSVTDGPVTVGGRTFQCQPWMVYQAHEFISMVKHMGDEFMLDIKGNGLIAHILKTGANLPEIEEV